MKIDLDAAVVIVAIVAVVYIATHTTPNPRKAQARNKVSQFPRSDVA